MIFTNQSRPTPAKETEHATRTRKRPSAANAGEGAVDSRLPIEANPVIEKLRAAITGWRTR